MVASGQNKTIRKPTKQETDHRFLHHFGTHQYGTRWNGEFVANFARKCQTHSAAMGKKPAIGL